MAREAMRERSSSAIRPMMPSISALSFQISELITDECSQGSCSKGMPHAISCAAPCSHSQVSRIRAAATASTASRSAERLPGRLRELPSRLDRGQALVDQMHREAEASFELPPEPMDLRRPIDLLVVHVKGRPNTNASGCHSRTKAAIAVPIRLVVAAAKRDKGVAERVMVWPTAIPILRGPKSKPSRVVMRLERIDPMDHRTLGVPGLAAE
jgi:hypothetical protein